MKAFQILQDNFAAFGIEPNQSKSNKRGVMTWLILSLSATSGSIFLAFDAKTFQEFINCMYTTSSAVVVAVIFTIMFLNMEKLFKLTDCIEKTIDKS